MHRSRVSYAHRQTVPFSDYWRKASTGTDLLMSAALANHKKITVLSTSLGKTSFCLAFYFKSKYYVLIDHILSETICLFCFCVCSQIFTLKLNLRPKICLTYAISIVKWFFLEFLFKKIVFTFLCWIWIIDVSQQYCENFRKIEQVEHVENLAPRYLPYRFLHDLASFLLWEKVKIFDFLKTND